MASQDMVAGAAPAEGLHRASMNERDGRAAVFAAGVCVLGTLMFLAGQLGWWTLLADPVYLAGITMVAMLARGRTHALLAVVLATGSMWILVGLAKLAGPYGIGVLWGRIRGLPTILGPSIS